MLIEGRPGDDAGLTTLLESALKELFTRYPDSSSHFLDPATEFLVAIDEGDAVGCIGLMPIVVGVGCYTKNLSGSSPPPPGVRADR